MNSLLERYNAKVTFFVSQFDSLDENEIRLLHELEKKGHEIGSHGAMHVVSEYFIKEKGYTDYLSNEVDQSIASMKKAGFDPVSFAYPYGAKYWFTDYLILKRFKSVRGVSPVNVEKDLTQIDEIYSHYNSNKFSAIGLDKNMNLSNDLVQKALLRAKQNKEVLFLYGHYPGSGSDGYQFNIHFLEFILKETKEQGLRFYLFKDLVAVT